jgi:NADH-quinone oxidoreductase subunit G
MARIQIEGINYEVRTDKNLLETCISLGFDIPYFCNHPALGSVGACRLCAVKKYAGTNDKTGRIIMSCMEPVTEGMIISVNDEEVKAFRAAVIEGLMTNHPHDCPVCDEGGECHLQDMTVMSGHNYRRYSFRKRTYTSQNLGPFIHHEMNRCIHCYRCLRFYRDYAGGKDLGVFGSANHVYFGRQKEGKLESEFSGNLVEVCPTGVFTDKTLKRHYTRKWDLSNAPSVCVHCSLGCNIIASERYGSVRRIMSRYNGSVNGYFICDRGRFGYEFINSPDRIKKIQIKSSGHTGLQEVISGIDTSGLTGIVNSGKIIGIGSPRASLEANYALSALTGMNNFFHGISGDEHRLVKKALRLMGSGLAHSPSLKEVESCDAVLIMAEDVSNTAPMLALALKQAVRNRSVGIAQKLGIPKWNDSAVRVMDQNDRSPLFIASPFSTRLDDIAEENYYSAPGDIARLGFAIASCLDPAAPVLPHPDIELLATARRIADALSAAENPLIVTGITGGDYIFNASANIAMALTQAGKKPSFSIVFPECNSVGLAMLEGDSLDEAIELVNKNCIYTLIVLENDLFRRASRKKIETFFDKFHQIIVLDHLMNETAQRAEVLLPSAAFAESGGTIINNEGRAQHFCRVLTADKPVKESWRWIRELMKIMETDKDNSWERSDDIIASLINSYPLFSGIEKMLTGNDFTFVNEKIARQNKRYSGRTAMNASISVSEPPLPQDLDSPLSFSMEGYKGDPPSSHIPYYWAPGWNSSQAVNKYMEEPGGHLREGGDPGLILFPDKNKCTIDYFKNIPEKFTSGSDELFIVPVHLIFGSEELSSRGEAISENIPEPFIILNEKDLNRFQLIEHEMFRFIINEAVVSVRIKTDNKIPYGIAGLSVSTLGMPYLDIPAWGKVFKNVADKT